MNNQYLLLLNKKITELKALLKKFKSANYSDEYKKYTVSGYIIMLNSILELGIGDLHSASFDELTSLIYYTRQKAVHYGYFNGVNNIQKTAEKIVEMFEQNYQEEEQYYKEIFNTNNYKSTTNVLIKAPFKMTEDFFFYKFFSKNNDSILYVPKSSTFKLTKQSEDKIDGLIIDTSSPLTIFYINNDKIKTHSMISEKRIKAFFNSNFIVSDIDYNKHTEAIQQIINSFITNPFNSTRVAQGDKGNYFCKGTVSIIKDFIFDRSFPQVFTEEFHVLKDDKRFLKQIKDVNANNLYASIRKNRTYKINKRDAFFIDLTIKRFEYYWKIIRSIDSANPDSTPLICTSLIQLFESGPKHLSDTFIDSNQMLSNIFNNLLKYRQIFSHYCLSNKVYVEEAQNFLSEFKVFLKAVSLIDTSYAPVPINESYNSYGLIEREKKDFFNYKHEQFLKIRNGTYIGKKIHYSSHNSTCDSLIAIIPTGTNASNMLYYEKDQNDYLTPKFLINEKTGKKLYPPFLISSLKDKKQVKIDFKLTNLFKAYHELKKFGKDSIFIYFNPCEENNNYPHHDSIDNIILRFYNQGYLPIELLQKTKLDLSLIKNGVIQLLNENNEPIAQIINKQKCSFNPYSTKDRKDFFSRIDDIEHDFSKRRHKK